MLDGFLADVDRSESRSLALRGEAGIGKTALLDYLIASATDMTVLRAVGVESEIELADASLHQLRAPLLDRRARLVGWASVVSPGLERRRPSDAHPPEPRQRCPAVCARGHGGDWRLTFFRVARSICRARRCCLPTRRGAPRAAGRVSDHGVRPPPSIAAVAGYHLIPSVRLRLRRKRTLSGGVRQSPDPRLAAPQAGNSQHYQCMVGPPWRTPASRVRDTAAFATVTREHGVEGVVCSGLIARGSQARRTASW